MGPYATLHVVLVGFFAFGALHYFFQWWQSRGERVLAVFALQCALGAAVSACLIAVAAATTIRTGELALEWRATFSLLTVATTTWLVSQLTGVATRRFVPCVVALAVGVAAISALVPLNGTVTEISRITTWWGETLAFPDRRPAPFWVAGPIYALVIASYAYGLVAAARVWTRDRLTSALIALACVASVAALVAGVAIDVLHVRTAYLGTPGLVVWVGVFAILLSREYANRGAQLAANDQRFRAIFDQTFQFIGLISVDGVVLEANQAARAFAGIRAEEIIGRIFWETPWWSHSPALQDRLRAAVGEAASGQTVRFEATHPRPEGGLAYIDFSIKPVRDERGDITRLIAEGRDITDRRQLEEQLRQSQKMEALGQLAGGVAHDFNNLLTVIGGYSDVLLAKLPADDPRSAYAQAIADASTRAAALTHRLLAFGRRNVMTPKVVDLNTVIADTEQLLRPLIGEDIQLSVVVGPTPHYVKVDPSLLSQALMNLAVNARDAMPRGGELALRAGETVGHGQVPQTYGEILPGLYAWLAVTDTGVGMTPDIRARIFDPFFSSKGVGRATGLGLSVVHGIVTQSGGHIDVDSTVGVGTTFTIYLPAVEEPESETNAAVHQSAAVGRETILLVEDERLVRDLIENALRAGGFSVFTAGDGQEALRLVDAQQPSIDLLVTDVVMPKVNGRQLADRLRAARPGLKVLFMSGYTDDALMRLGMFDAQEGFLQKPFAIDSLVQRVRHILDS